MQSHSQLKHSCKPGFSGWETHMAFCCCCSVTQSCLTLCNSMDCSTPGFPVLCCLLEFAQTHVHWLYDAIQPSHPLSPSSPALNLSQHQSFSVSQLLASGGQSFQTFLPKTRTLCASNLSIRIYAWACMHVLKAQVSWNNLSPTALMLSRFSRVRLCATP